MIKLKNKFTRILFCLFAFLQLFFINFNLLYAIPTNKNQYKDLQKEQYILLLEQKINHYEKFINLLFPDLCDESLSIINHKEDHSLDKFENLSKNFQSMILDKGKKINILHQTEDAFRLAITNLLDKEGINNCLSCEPSTSSDKPSENKNKQKIQEFSSNLNFAEQDVNLSHDDSDDIISFPKTFWDISHNNLKNANASEISIIMELNHFKDKKEFLTNKLQNIVAAKRKLKRNSSNNIATDHGNKLENSALKCINKKESANYQPTVFRKGFYNAIVDGYDKETNTLIEIKCPLKETAFWKKVRYNQQVPPIYMAQIQCELLCSNADMGFLVVYYNDDNYFKIPVSLDLKFIEEMNNKSTKYKNFLDDCEKALDIEYPYYLIENQIQDLIAKANL
jgi:putative phage-type endonuclease